jgi:hypothetical protein
MGQLGFDPQAHRQLWAQVDGQNCPDFEGILGVVFSLMTSIAIRLWYLAQPMLKELSAI